MVFLPVGSLDHPAGRHLAAMVVPLPRSATRRRGALFCFNLLEE